MFIPVSDDIFSPLFKPLHKSNIYRQQLIHLHQVNKVQYGQEKDNILRYFCPNNAFDQLCVTQETSCGQIFLTVLQQQVR